ncbi:hypothetical protein EVAR_32582_1 [Eumeta japonica]|uniref:Uncharacterized protein n=1 Tax=Eumeta variegata TaxID=151549 RepID=A0A4C1VSE9_EUMVA|nr:hypothetical protein EVAR_32582_1 [Eumeta japonica]
MCFSIAGGVLSVRGEGAFSFRVEWGPPEMATTSSPGALFHAAVTSGSFYDPRPSPALNPLIYPGEHKPWPRQKLIGFKGAPCRRFGRVGRAAGRPISRPSLQMTLEAFQVSAPGTRSLRLENSNLNL